MGDEVSKDPDEFVMTQELMAVPGSCFVLEL